MNNVIEHRNYVDMNTVEVQNFGAIVNIVTPDGVFCVKRDSLEVEPDTKIRDAVYFLLGRQTTNSMDEFHIASLVGNAQYVTIFPYAELMEQVNAE